MSRCSIARCLASVVTIITTGAVIYVAPFGPLVTRVLDAEQAPVAAHGDLPVPPPAVLGATGSTSGPLGDGWRRTTGPARGTCGAPTGSIPTIPTCTTCGSTARALDLDTCVELILAAARSRAALPGGDTSPTGSAPGGPR